MTPARTIADGAQASRGFDISVEREGGAVALRVRGTVDAGPSAAALASAVDDAVQASATALVVDCTGVELMSTAAVSALLRAMAACRARGVAVDFRPGPSVVRLFALAGVPLVA